MIDFQQIQMDYATCYMDKTRIKFIEKYLSTFNASAGKLTPFILFPRQKVFLQSLSDNKASIAIKHRQCGITTISSAWMAAQCVFASKESPETILCIANKLDQANEIIVKIRDFLLQVPRWYWGDEYFSVDPKSEKNVKDIFVKNSKSMLELFNGCKVYARSSGPNAARGISAVSLLIFDEAAFIEDGLAVYSSAVAATASVPNAKIIMVSTPNGKDELYYNTYKQALAKENNYNAIEFKWYQDLRYNKFLEWHRKNELTGEEEVIKEDILDNTGTVPYDEEKWKKLEKEGWIPNSPWYTMMCQSFNNDSMKIAQELDVSFMGSANNVVDPKSIEMQEQLNVKDPLENMKDPLVEETWFWKPPIEGHRYICACLPEGEEVLTNKGLTKIENVTQDYELVTKNGNYAKIKECKKRVSTNEEIIGIRTVNSCDFINFTWNHPILASINTQLKRYSKNNGGKRYWDFKFEFYNANVLKEKDWVQMPNLYRRELSNEEILSHWLKENVTRKDFNVNNPLLDKDFWWYCGIWLAEGWTQIDKNNFITINTAHHSKEKEIHEKIDNLVKRLFNRTINKRTIEENHSTTLRFNSKEVGIFLHQNFGKYAKHKYISEWIKFLPQELKKELIKGYLEGDGYIHKNQKYCGFTSVSKKLLKDVQDILFSCGIISNLKLHVKEGKRKLKIKNKEKLSNISNKYELSLGLYDTKLLLDYLGIENSICLKNRRIISGVVFSEDKNTIYFQIAKIEKKQYNGHVYNFEVDDETHTFCCHNIVTHNCDPSRGVATDRTSIQIIDMDGRDENGMPILEQVMEYNGKKLGDDIGGLTYQYATMYNNAFVVFDATGGQADAPILAMMSMGYKNMYYEDANQKTYMLQNHQFSQSYNDRLPGFHFQGNRYPVLANFAGMVRNNEFKIRSIRVINELETWIFKGDTGRMDHMDGAHDDNICALAMALFVMQYSVNKIEDVKHKDAAILSAYMMNGSTHKSSITDKSSVSMQPKQSLPFYNNKTLGKYSPNVGGSYLWLLSGKI